MIAPKPLYDFLDQLRSEWGTWEHRRQHVPKCIAALEEFIAEFEKADGPLMIQRYMETDARELTAYAEWLIGRAEKMDRPSDELLDRIERVLRRFDAHRMARGISDDAPSHDSEVIARGLSTPADTENTK